MERVSGAASNGMNSLSWVLETEAFQTEATISYGIKSKWLRVQKLNILHLIWSFLKYGRDI